MYMYVYMYMYICVGVRWGGVPPPPNGTPPLLWVWVGLSGFGHPEWDHHLKGNLDVVCFFNTDNLSERFSDFPEMPKVDYLAYPNSSDYLA